MRDKFTKRLLPVLVAAAICALALTQGRLDAAYALGVPQFEFGAVSNTSIELDLYADAGAICRVYRSQPGQAVNFQEVYSTTDPGLWTDTGLTPDTYYHYYLVAYGDEEMQQSATRRIKTEANVATVQVSIQTYTNASITVRWAAYSGAVSYNIYRSMDGATFALHDTAAGAATTYADIGLGGGTYYYQVKAVLSDGAEVDSNTASQSVAGEPLATPNIMVGSYAESIGLNPNWTRPPGATSYTVYRGDTQYGAFTQVATVTTNEYADYDVLPNTTYWYYVVATDGVRTSTSGKASGKTISTAPTATPTPTPTATPVPTATPKPTATATPKPTPTPTPRPTPTPTPKPTPTPTPAGPAAPYFWLTSGSTQETTVKWSWAGLSRPHSQYKIYYSTSESGPYRLVYTYTPGSNAKLGVLYYSINQKPVNPLGLQNGTKYYIKMSSVDSSGREGPMSSYARYFYAFQPTQTAGFGSAP